MKFWSLAAVLFALAFSGCTARHWKAQINMLKAEEAFSKAYRMRVKKIPYEERIKFYREACDSFLEALHADPEVFTLNRIQSAADACSWVRNSEAQDEFRLFEEDYSKKHPNEYEYGDAFPSIVE